MAHYYEQSSVETIWDFIKDHLPSNNYRIVRVFFPVTTASDTEFVYDVRIDAYYYKLHSRNVRKKLISRLKEQNISTKIYHVKEKFYTDPKKRANAGIMLEMSIGKKDTGCSIV